MGGCWEGFIAGGGDPQSEGLEFRGSGLRGLVGYGGLGFGG